jgi:predicted RNA-binding Zn-ribbon protein involved in translation (DUF1610 family)
MDPVLLDNLIARLEADLDLTAERLRLARELRATFETGAAPATAPVSPPAAPSPTEPAQRAPKKPNPSYERTACPDCGEMIARNRMSTHRNARHPGSAAKPIAPAPAPTPKVEPPAAAELPAQVVYECSDCGARTPNKQALAKHTTDRHHRGLHAEEHLAMDPAKAAA